MISRFQKGNQSLKAKPLLFVIALSVFPWVWAQEFKDLDPTMVGIWGSGYNAGPVALQGNHAYLLSRTPPAVHVIDVADPASPRETAVLALTGDPQQIVV